MQHEQVIPILDFGAQYAQLIARRVREKGVYSELVRHDISVEQLRKLNPKGLILSGAPAASTSRARPNVTRASSTWASRSLASVTGCNWARRSWVGTSSPQRPAS